MFETIDESNFLNYAIHNYDNSCVDQLELMEDINRFKYLKRLFSKYRESGDLKERLILNHLIVLYNVFKRKACTRMLCYRLIDHLEGLKPFLVYLNQWPEIVEPIGSKRLVIIGSDIKLDPHVVQVLRKM